MSESTVWSSIAQSYHHTITHVTPGPNNISYILAFLLLPISLLIPPSVLTHRQLCCLFLPLIYALLLRSWSQMHGVDVLSVDLALWSFNILAFRDPRATFKRVWVKRNSSAVQTSEQNETDHPSHAWDESYPSNLSARIPWVAAALLSFRYTHWKIGDPHHDQTQPYKAVTRGAYLKQASLLILSNLLLLDVARSYAETDPYFIQPMSIDTPIPPSPPSTPTIFVLLRLLPPRLVRIASLSGQFYSSVSLMFNLPSLLAAAIGILPDGWSPHTWPGFFGSFSAVSTAGLRGLWGTWWHQINRHIMSTPGRAFNKLLGISGTSTAGYASLTISAFFFSGLIHVGLVPPEPSHPKVPVNMIRLSIALFFWVQAVGFGIELVAIRLLSGLAQKLPPAVTRVLVFSWTAVWLCLTLPLLAHAFIGLKFWELYPLPISIVQGLSGNGWLCW